MVVTVAERFYSFTVPFVRGKGRVKFVKATGRTYTPDSTAEAMERVRQAFAAIGGERAPEGVPVRVSITTARGMPKSRPKRLESEPDVYKPDADNIAKLVLDSLNGTAWVDDTQVNVLSVQKYDRDRVAEEQTHIIVSWEDE